MAAQGKERRPAIPEAARAELQAIFTKLRNLVDDSVAEQPLTSEDYMRYYECVYDVCTLGDDFAADVYTFYKSSINEYLTSVVLPSLRDKQDEIMLKEVVKRWQDHELMIRWAFRFFHYLERYLIPKRGLTPLKEAGFDCFRDLVYEEEKEQIREAVLSLIEQERNGGEIDQALVKDAVNIFVKIGSGDMVHYERDFEAFLIRNTASYYSTLASAWIHKYPPAEYKLKVEETMDRERERIAHYLPSGRAKALVEVVERELSQVTREGSADQC